MLSICAQLAEFALQGISLRGLSPASLELPLFSLASPLLPSCTSACVNNVGAEACGAQNAKAFI